MRELIFIRRNKNPQASTQTQCQWRQRKVQLGTACNNKSKKTTKLRRAADPLKPVRRRDATLMCMCYEVKDRLIHPSSGWLIFCTIVSEIPDVIFDRVVQKSCKALDTVLLTPAVPPHHRHPSLAECRCSWDKPMTDICRTRIHCCCSCGVTDVFLPIVARIWKLLIASAVNHRNKRFQACERENA